ncbi:MAG: hypothetical protein ACYDDF_01005 [Thermoplasmatota archaeon]
MALVAASGTVAEPWPLGTFAASYTMNDASKTVAYSSTGAFTSTIQCDSGWVIGPSSSLINPSPAHVLSVSVSYATGEIQVTSQTGYDVTAISITCADFTVRPAKMQPEFGSSQWGCTGSYKPPWGQPVADAGNGSPYQLWPNTYLSPFTNQTRPNDSFIERGVEQPSTQGVCLVLGGLGIGNGQVPFTGTVSGSVEDTAGPDASVQAAAAANACDMIAGQCFDASNTSFANAAYTACGVSSTTRAFCTGYVKVAAKGLFGIEGVEAGVWKESVYAVPATCPC